MGNLASGVGSGSLSRHRYLSEHDLFCTCREVFKARHRKSAKLCALKKFIMDKEVNGVRCLRFFNLPLVMDEKRRCSYVFTRTEIIFLKFLIFEHFCIWIRLIYVV